MRDSVSIYDLAFEVQLGSPCFSSRYLAYENGRIAVATVRSFLSPLPGTLVLRTLHIYSARVSSLYDLSFRIPILG
jgi:hypothetical protein